MGALYRGSCHADDVAATHAAYSDTGPAIAPGSVTTVEHDGINWNLVTRHETGTATVALPQLQFFECNPLDAYLDGVTLGWAIAGVWVAAYVVMALKHATLSR